MLAGACRLMRRRLWDGAARRGLPTQVTKLVSKD
jgi:hypothetical protein